MVDNALIAATEFDIFSLDPATCAVNWRTHEDYPPALLPSNRGAAYLDGMLFRGTQDGRVLAYDFKTGKRIWEQRIADPMHGKSVSYGFYATDADTGVWKWRLKSNYPIVSGMTPTAGGVVFFGDMGGNFYALDSANGEKLWGQDLGGAIGGGVITYRANGAQKVAVAVGVVMAAWPTKIVKAKSWCWASTARQRANDKDLNSGQRLAGRYSRTL